MDSDNERYEYTTPSEPEPNDSERALTESDNDADTPARGDHSEVPRGTANRGAKEIGGRAGPDPARYGDWEKNGRCIDF